jgi:murein L,D-transpeptidase YafK
VKRFSLAAPLLVVLLAAAWAHWPESRLGPSVRADRVLVRKAYRRLELYAGGRLLKAYAISLGGNPAGHKHRQGDERTPEGVYVFDSRNANSLFYRSMHISYPSAADSATAAANHADPGGAIMLHGLRNGLGWLGRLHLAVDWTDGCIAVTDVQMDEIWRLVADGTTIEIEP